MGEPFPGGGRRRPASNASRMTDEGEAPYLGQGNGGTAHLRLHFPLNPFSWDGKIR